jgi:hypothetical protein
VGTEAVFYGSKLGGVKWMAKLTWEERQKFLNERLVEQHHLLRKSIDEFASGDLAEAIRIATVIRVLAHETASSKPLLKQLTPNYLELKILDSKPTIPEKLPPGIQSAVVMSVPISVKITEHGVFLDKELHLEAKALSILGRWWTRTSLILPGLGGFSRKEVILGLANKEGGAHVDTDITRKYQQLLDCKSLQIGWGRENVSPIKLSRFVSGQAGVELLDCLNRSFPAISGPDLTDPRKEAE